MDSALGRERNTGEPAQQTLADLAGAPAGMLLLHVQDKVLDLKWKLVAIAIWAPTAVGQPLQPTRLITVKDLVAGLPRDAELPAKLGHRLAGEPQTAVFRLSPNTPSKASFPPFMGGKCYLCVRYNVSPMSQVAHKTSNLLAPEFW